MELYKTYINPPKITNDKQSAGPHRIDLDDNSPGRWHFFQK
jgi:hypothetical protein